MLVSNDVVLVLPAINLMYLKITRWMYPLISPMVILIPAVPVDNKVKKKSLKGKKYVLLFKAFI